MNFHDLKLKLLSQVPVNGPHADIEGQLLLLGKKPMGWINLYPPSIAALEPLPPKLRHDLDIQRRLDEAVAAGRLKSQDVVIRVEAPLRTGRDFVPDREDISRHYCQPNREKDLKVMSAFNQAATSKQKIDVKLDKDFGDYLGYRKRDQFMWNFRHRHRIPRKLGEAWLDFAHNVAKPAYQELLLRSWNDTSQDAPPSTAPPPSDPGVPAFQVDIGWRCWMESEHVRAAKWFRRAAEQDDKVGQHNLGGMYETGEGVKKDLAEAFFWHSLAAKGQPRLYSQDDALRIAAQLTPEQIEAVTKRVEAWKPSAPSAAPDALEDGIAAFKRKDGAAALSLLQPLAEQGDADAQLHVGRIHLAGMGVPKDNAEALNWLGRAADQGLAGAQAELGQHYQFGIGNDPVKAAALLLKAAVQGQGHAQFLLSSAYANGSGVEKDPMASLFWHLRATNFRPLEDFMKKTAAALSPEQIDTVTKGAEAWRPAYAGPVAADTAPAVPVARLGRYAHFPVIWSGTRS